MKYELQIIGINAILISALLTGSFLVICATGGENVTWEYLGFELIFPFYLSVVIGEWCKIRTDSMFEVIVAQGKFLFHWIFRRFILLFGMVSIFAVIGMIGVLLLKTTTSFSNMISAFFPTAFFLASLCTFVSIFTDIPHISTMVVSVFWLFSIMTMSLLRIKPLQYLYIFARYADIKAPLWMINKGILIAIGIFLWISIYVIIKIPLSSFGKFCHPTAHFH
ncbi:unknown [Firmicutes bacterium CAG:646]|nr:unknown [Firmicutes bacterium CAG:646]